MFKKFCFTFSILLFLFFFKSPVLAQDPSCSSLNLSSSEIQLGSSINVSAFFHYYGKIRYAKVSASGDRCASFNCQTLKSGYDSLSTSFAPSEVGLYVFELNAYESTECRYLCSAGSTLYENTCPPNNCVTRGCWGNAVGGCTSSGCIKYLTVTAPPTCNGTDTSCGVYPNCRNCNSSDGWYNSGAPYSCCSEGDKYTCQKQKKRDYYCSGTSCNYSVIGTRTVKTDFVYCPYGCLDGACLDQCVNVSYSTNPATVYEGESFKIIADRAGATNCQGNWLDVGSKLDGVYTPGYYGKWSTKYSWLYSSGLSVGRHNFRMTVNNGSCVCNNFRFWVKAVPTPTPTPVPTSTPTPTPTPVPACIPAVNPTLEILNTVPYENPVYFQWNKQGDDCLDYESSFEGNPLPSLSYSGTPETKVEEEKVDYDGPGGWITAKVLGKNVLDISCSACLMDNGLSCCLSDWVQKSWCISCKNPTAVNAKKIDCGTFDGTEVSWNDQSNWEDGFKIYRDGVLTGSVGRHDGTGNVTWDHCDLPYDGNAEYEVRCFTVHCGPDNPAPTCPCDEGWQDVGCDLSCGSAGNCTSDQMCQVKYCYLTYWDGGKGELCDTKYRCIDDPDCISSWFQVQEGDVYANWRIKSKVPEEEYFCLTGEGGVPGVVVYRGGTSYFGDGEVSEEEWLAETEQPVSTSYFNYFYQLLGSPVKETAPSGGSFSNDDLHSRITGTEGIIAFDGDIQTGNGWLVGKKKMVLLIDGKFLIKNQIRINPGGSLVVVVSGAIAVSGDKEITGSGNSRIRGVFVTDGKFYSSVDPSAFPTFTSTESDKVLVIDGSVVAGNGVDLARDLGADNDTMPAELFRFDPALMINSYQAIWQQNFTWQELAP